MNYRVRKDGSRTIEMGFNEFTTLTIEEAMILFNDGFACECDDGKVHHIVFENI